MHKLILSTVKAARNSSGSVYECCLLAAKCDKAAVQAFRAANGVGVKSFSTTSRRHCEKNNEVAPSQQSDKTLADKAEEPTETPTPPAQKAEDDSPVDKMSQESQEPVVLTTDNGSATQQQTEITEVVLATPKPAKPPASKSGKESLLDLLGAMKVEVTTKRRLKNMKLMNQVSESAPKPKLEEMESTISMFQKATEEAAAQSETLDPGLVAAASAAASTLPNRSQAQSELLKQLRRNEAITEAQKKGDVNSLGNIIADMRVGKSTTRQGSRTAHQIRFDDDGQGYTQERGITSELDAVRRRRNLFTGKRLNIFSLKTLEDGVESTAGRPTLWDMEFANQLSNVTNHLPCSGLEEMIQWTKEGKMWQYPINNEAGLEEESSVSFHEHVFLDQHLESFPRQGPVRHFMELVVAGLSKNPYLTVQQKKEHIAWFKDYFHQKEEVLKEADVYLN